MSKWVFSVCFCFANRKLAIIDGADSGHPLDQISVFPVRHSPHDFLSPLQPGGELPTAIYFHACTVVFLIVEKHISEPNSLPKGGKQNTEDLVMLLHDD